MALSLYSTRLKSGEVERADPAARPTPTTPSSTTTARCALGGGLRPRRTCACGSSTARPWSAAAWSTTSSRPGSSGPSRASCRWPTRTSSIEPVAQEFLRLVNPRPRAVRRTADRRGARSAGRRVSRGSFPGAARGRRGPRSRPSTASTGRRTSGSAQRLLPRAGALFDEDFSAYPETEDSREVDARRLRRGRRAAARPRRPRCAGWRPRSPSATRGCTGRGTSRQPPERALAGRCAGARSMPRRTGRWPSTCSGSTGSARRSPRARRAAELKPGELRVPAFPRNPAAAGRRLRRRGRGAGAGARAEPRPCRLAARARAGADPARRRGRGAGAARRTERGHMADPLSP